MSITGAILLSKYRNLYLFTHWRDQDHMTIRCDSDASSQIKQSNLNVYSLLTASPMPESREEDSHSFLFNYNFESLKDKSSFQLIGIHADVSKTEETRHKAEDGHIILLSPNCDIVRGTCNSQTYLFPKDFAHTEGNLNPQSITTLTLERAHSANRAIILDFGTYFLKVRNFLSFFPYFYLFFRYIYTFLGGIFDTYIHPVLFAKSLDRFNFQH